MAVGSSIQGFPSAVEIGGEKPMRTLLVTLLALAAGFIAGVILSELIGVIGFLWMGQAVGMKYLPVYLAAVFAAVAWIWLSRKESA